MARRRRHRTLIRLLWTVGIVGGLSVAGAIGLWFGFHRIPSWYRPIRVASHDLARVRNSVPNTYDALNERIHDGAPFSFAITGRTLTEWLVARADLYPDAADWLPPVIHDPVVTFRDDACVIGARINYRGWQTILGIHLVADVAGDDINCRVTRVSCGALPIPLGQLAAPLDRFLRDAKLDLEQLPVSVAEQLTDLRAHGSARLLTDGITLRNLFRTGSGTRAVKIRRLAADDDELIANLEPW